MKSEKLKRWFLVFSLIFLAIVILLVLFPNTSKTEEEKIIELSKKTFDKYAPDYDYLESSEHWLVNFNDYDGEGTITVWAPSDNGLRGCVMFERQSDKIAAYYVEVDHEERYSCERKNDPISSTQEEIFLDDSDTQVSSIDEYLEIADLFSSVVPDSEIKVNLRNGNTLNTKIKTQFSSESAPDGWAGILTAFETALSAADEKKGEYGASVASGEILSADETILSSGFNSKVQFNKFEEKDFGENGDINPPTISKFEYDQISVGMTLSQVREIVGGDGTLENSIGTAGVTSTVQTYRFLGEKEGSYADILFDDYVVYSKIQIFLE